MQLVQLQKQHVRAFQMIQYVRAGGCPICDETSVVSGRKKRIMAMNNLPCLYQNLETEITVMLLEKFLHAKMRPVQCVASSWGYDLLNIYP